MRAASYTGGALAACDALGLDKTAKDCFFCAASKGALTPNMTLMRGPPPIGKGSFKQDTAHFWLEDKKGKVTDPTAYQYPEGYDYSKGKPVNLMANLDAVIDDPLFKTLSRTHQRKIKKLWKRHGEVKTANLATVLAVLGAGAGAGVGRHLARADKKTVGTLIGAAVGAGAGAASTPVLRMPIAHGMASLMELSDNPFLHAEARNLRQTGSLSEEAHHEGPSEAAKQKLRDAARRIRERLEAAGLDPSKARVAISGTGGTGKSTLAKEIARSMGLKYQGLDWAISPLTRLFGMADAHREMKFEPGSVVEQTHLTNNVDPDRFDAIIRVHRPYKEIQQQVLKRGRGAAQLTILDYPKLDKAIAAGFHLTSGPKETINENIELKVKPPGGFRADEHLDRVLERLGVDPKGLKRNQKILSAITGERDEAVGGGVIPYTKLGQHRERVEVYGVTPGGKILGGLYPEDGSFGTFGGGIDPGETKLEAAQREYLEEAGRRITNLRPVSKPFVQPWLVHDVSAKQKRRYARYPEGNKTHFIVGQLGRKGRAQDLSDTGSRMHDIKLRPIADVIETQREAIRAGGPDDVIDRMKRRLRVLKHIEKSLEKNSQEFAPGIPKSKPTSRLPRIEPKHPLRWVMAVQDHEAKRARRHYDLRLVDPDAHKAHSWAIPKARLPEPGERLLAVQTFTHTPEYALHFGEKKPQTIGKGYGAGRVRMAVKAPTEIIEANNTKVRFNVYDGRNNQEYLLKRTKGDKWLLMNTTITKDRQDIPQSKPKYKEVEPDAIDVTDDQQLMMAKVDGAHNTFRLDAGKPLRVFSHRPTERATGVIEHTHRFVPGLQIRVPKQLDGLVLRGELFAADPHTGRAREAVETGAVLNSGVWKSRETQEHSPLRAVIFDVARRAGKNVEAIPYKEKLEILRKVHQALPILELPPMARTSRDKVELLNRIRTGQEPITREGVVLWPLKGGAPVKAKFRPEHDVYVRQIHPETGERHGLAGAFSYSWTPRGKIVGRVGTGLNHDLKRDMLENPSKYIGRVARVRAEAVYRDKKNPKKPGALRAPSFQDWHLDKGHQPIE